MSERENTHAQEATIRGEDDRRKAVRPGDSPAPRSPEPDRDAVEKGEEILERIKPY